MYKNGGLLKLYRTASLKLTVKFAKYSKCFIAAAFIHNRAAINSSKNLTSSTKHPARAFQLCAPLLFLRWVPAHP
jgi:hypothetical protein